MSYFSQVFGLTSQNFLVGAAGLAVGIAFRGVFAAGLMIGRPRNTSATKSRPAP
jgi:hypothetical protein